MPYLKKLTPCPEPIDCKILTAALELIVDQGYQRVSIHDIQKKANVSIGSIYNHFGGKEGVAKGLYQHLLNELDEWIDEVKLSNSTSKTQCFSLVKQLFEFSETHPYIIAFLFNTKHDDFISDTPTLYHSTPMSKIIKCIDFGITSKQMVENDKIIVFSSIFGAAVHLVQLRFQGVIKQPLTNYQASFLQSIQHHFS